MPSSNRLRIMFIFGTRPEAIKMAPVILMAKSRPEFEVLVCTTGQHREMLDQVLTLFGIQADVDLNLMKAGQTLSTLTASAVIACTSVLEKYRPAIVLVHGDTTTTFAASLAAYYTKTPVAHVEAGLRTGNPYSPWPEEINRRLTGVIASIHFAPTETASRNLLAENVSAASIHVTGNTVIDALQQTCARIRNDITLSENLAQRFVFLDRSRRLLLVTGHRRENFGAGFISICSALREIARREDIEIVYPVHLNPNVKGPVHEMLGGLANVHLIEPLDYLPFVHLLSRCYFVLTDSGGIQEEAPALGKPVLVMRDTTERPEAIDAGTARLVGTDSDAIIKAALELLDQSDLYDAMSKAHNPYGDGQASGRILNILGQFGGKL
jgi:UDP-N-acetylglucosamine 2-epimerase (non-hydrolysing)